MWLRERSARNGCKETNVPICKSYFALLDFPTILVLNEYILVSLEINEKMIFLLTLRDQGKITKEMGELA